MLIYSKLHKKNKSCGYYMYNFKIKTIRIVCTLSLVNSCVKMRVCKHGCDITQILIGYVLSEVHFYWLVGNMSVYQESLFQSRSKKQHFPSIEDFFCVYSVHSLIYCKHSGELGEFKTVMQTCDTVDSLYNCLEFSQLPRIYLDEAMCPVNTEKSPLSLKKYTCTRKIRDSLR